MEVTVTTAADMMTDHPQTASPECPLRRAAELMREYDCGALPVVENGTAVGMVTDRDLVIRAMADGLDTNTAKLRDIMTKGVVTCYASDSLELAADKMADNDVHRLVVLDAGDQVIGIISVDDIVKSPDSDLVNDEVLHHLYRYA
jgi:CBS domain-containing protein